MEDTKLQNRLNLVKARIDQMENTTLYGTFERDRQLKILNDELREIESLQKLANDENRL